MKLYKLTDKNHQTRYHTQWGPGVTLIATGLDTRLCSCGVIHAYENPYVAVLLNPIHADFDKPVLWEAEGDVVVREGPLKCGVKQLTTIRRIALPRINRAQRFEIALRCSLTVQQPPEYRKWARAWLNGTDRTKKSSDSVYSTEFALAYRTLIATYYWRSMSQKHHEAVALAIERTYGLNSGLRLVGIINRVLGTKVKK